MRTIYRDPTSRHHFDPEEKVEAWFAKQRVMHRKIALEKLTMDTLWKHRSDLLATVPAVLKRIDAQKRADERGQTSLM